MILLSLEPTNAIVAMKCWIEAPQEFGVGRVVEKWLSNRGPRRTKLSGLLVITRYYKLVVIFYDGSIVGIQQPILRDIYQLVSFTLYISPIQVGTRWGNTSRLTMLQRGSFEFETCKLWPWKFPNISPLKGDTLPSYCLSILSIRKKRANSEYHFFLRNTWERWSRETKTCQKRSVWCLLSSLIGTFTWSSGEPGNKNTGFEVQNQATMLGYSGSGPKEQAWFVASSVSLKTKGLLYIEEPGLFFFVCA